MVKIPEYLSSVEYRVSINYQCMSCGNVRGWLQRTNMKFQEIRWCVCCNHQEITIHECVEGMTQDYIDLWEVRKKLIPPKWEVRGGDKV